MRRKLQKYATKENADVNDLDFSALEADKSPQRRNKGSRTTKPRAKKPDGTYEPGSMPTMIDGVQMPMLKPMGDHPQLVKAQATLGAVSHQQAAPLVPHWDSLCWLRYLQHLRPSDSSASPSILPLSWRDPHRPIV